MYAVTIEPLKAVFFLAEDPGEGPWNVEGGIDLDFPPNYDLWPEGSPMPEQVVCVSTTDPKHFKVYKYNQDIDPDEFRSTRMTFGGFYSRRAWERFTSKLSAHLRFANIPDDQPPVATVGSTPKHGGDQ